MTARPRRRGSGAGADEPPPLPSSLADHLLAVAPAGDPRFASKRLANQAHAILARLGFSYNLPRAVYYQGLAVAEQGSLDQAVPPPPADVDVYGQRYTSAGIARGGEFRVNTTITGNQFRGGAKYAKSPKQWFGSARTRRPTSPERLCRSTAACR